MITTTTDHLEGYKITEYLGIVFAEVSNRYDLNEPYFWNSSETAHHADAIIGIHYVIARSSGLTQKLIGTAVKIEKI